MKLKLSVDQSTAPSELIILSAFFESLALAREGHVVSVPAEDAGDDPTPDDTVVVQVPPAAAGEEAPKRRRRTKAEIEADAAKLEAGNEQAASTPTVPETSVAPAAPVEAGNVETPAPTPTAPETTSGAAETPATASPSDAGKTYTHAEVQALAVDTARRYGPEKVKALIATYPNAAKIAELGEGDLAGFVAKLQAITA